jgi:hypothetical protein
VGASLLAMDFNEDAFFLNGRGAFECIASKLAPTVGRLCGQNFTVCLSICAAGVSLGLTIA